MTTLTSAQIKEEIAGLTVTCLDNAYGVIAHRWLASQFTVSLSDH